MYIPTLILPQQGEMDTGSLKQLINRVGRKKDKSATIYTSPEFVDKVKGALRGDLEDLENQPFVLPGSPYYKVEAGANYATGVAIESGKETGEALLNLGKGLIKIFYP